jgi:hypothetical protein
VWFDAYLRRRSRDRWLDEHSSRSTRRNLEDASRLLVSYWRERTTEQW